MTAQTAMNRPSRDGGSMKLGVTPLGGGPDGIWERGTPGGSWEDIGICGTRSVDRIG